MMHGDQCCTVTHLSLSSLTLRSPYNFLKGQTCGSLKSPLLWLYAACVCHHYL